MADLTDKKKDFIVMRPDAKALAAIESWLDKQTPGAKANISVSSGYVVSLPDPLNQLEATRDALIALVDKEAESMSSVVRLQFDGPTFSVIVMQVAKPPEVPEK